MLNRTLYNQSIWFASAVALCASFKCDSLSLVWPLSAEEAKCAGIDFVFVHGLNTTGAEDHPYSTWAAGNILWPRDFLPMAVPQARIFIFGYNAMSSLKILDNGEKHANALLELLNIQREDCPERPLAFVCHGFGGLVVKQALLNASKVFADVSKATVGLMFFGTPHRVLEGSSICNPNHSLHALTRFRSGDISYFKKLRDQFKDILERYRIVNCHESRECKSNLFVDSYSATFGLPRTREAVISIDEVHSNICKFSTVDGIYTLVEFHIVEFVEAANIKHEPV